MGSFQLERKTVGLKPFGFSLLFAGVLFLTVVLFLGGTLFYRVTHRVMGRYFDSRGVPIHFTDEGKGEPVILLHGFAIHSDLNWRRPGILSVLTPDFRVLSMDLRGHGLSGKPHDPEKYGTEMAKDVVRLMDFLGLERAHVAGYSLGAFITLYLAAEFPDRLKSACILGGGWEPPDNTTFFKAVERLSNDLEAGKGISPLSGNLGSDRPAPSRVHRFWVRLMTRYFNDPIALAGVVRGLPRLALPEERVRDISIPLLAVVGDRDPLKVSVERLKSRVPELRLVVVEGADHLRTPKRPELKQALRSFLLEHSTEK